MNVNQRISLALRVRAPSNYEDVFFDAIPQSKCVRYGNSMMPLDADYFFSCNSSQEVVFDVAARPHIDKFQKGEDNIAFVCFGPTYSGKTFTMFGPGMQFTNSATMYGIFPRFATYLFSQYNPTLVQGNNAPVRVKVSFIEVNSYQIRDLLRNTVLTPQLGTLVRLKTVDAMQNLEYENCFSPGELINCLHIALTNRMEPAAHMIGEVILEQPILQRDGMFKHVRTTALFADVGCTVIEHPSMMRHPNGNQPVLIQEDRFVFITLAKDPEGLSANENRFLGESHLLNILKSSFNGGRSSLVFCCIAPPGQLFTVNDCYVRDLHLLTQLKNILTERLSMQRNLQEVKASSLISEAESLLSRLSITKSVSEEDQERLKLWLQMKRECEESLNEQSHGQLECIEEVTESEEEIASSNEKMSESPVSLDNSLSESDQEEGDGKSYQLSDNNFYSNLNNMCGQFNNFVDKLVDSFKAKTSLSPAKERKRDYSAVRRGGMTEPPREFRSQVASTASCSLDISQSGSHNNQATQAVGGQSTGCIRKTMFSRNVKSEKEQPTRGSSKGKERREGDSEKDMSDAIDKATQELNSLVQDVEKTKNSVRARSTWPIIGASVISGSEMRNMLNVQIKQLQQISETLTVSVDCNLFPPTKNKGEKLVSLEVERNKDIFHAISGIEPFISMLRRILNRGFVEEHDSDWWSYHSIRWHRFHKQEFLRYKNELDAAVKNKTASDNEIRDHLIADEMIELLDWCIEFLNCMILDKPAKQNVPNTHVAAEALEKLKTLTSSEMNSLLSKYFMKVVDLREGSKQMESTISDLEGKLDVAKMRIHILTQTIQDMRSHQNPSGQAVTRFSPPEDTFSGRSPSSPPLALPGGSKSRRGPSIPQQNLSKLQVTKAVPPAKVTFTNKKLIIEQSNSQNKH